MTNCHRKENFHQEVSIITVIAIGGWSKRSHKHTYNSIVGVAITVMQKGYSHQSVTMNSSKTEMKVVMPWKQTV